MQSNKARSSGGPAPTGRRNAAPAAGHVSARGGRPGEVDSTPHGFGREETSASSASAELFLDLPLLETLNRINAQVGGLQKQLAKVDDQVNKAMLPEEEPEPTKTFITDVDSEEKSKKKVLEAKVESPQNTKSVDDVRFPGLGKKPTDIPNNVSVQEVLTRLADKMQITKSQEQQAWQLGLTTSHTQDIMKDLFWWFFCEKFENSKHPEEQEKMFSRMASNFICLMTTIPHSHKDKFFDRYHDVLSQAVYAAFR